MSHTLPIEQISAQLTGLIRALGPDEVIVLTDNDKPIARIVRNTAALPKRAAGAWEGLLTINKEDDEHLDDFKEYMP